MTIGPLELLVLGFEGNNFRGEIAPAIEAAEKSGAVRVVDLIFARKDANGSITTMEVEESDEAYARNFEGLKMDIRGILTAEDTTTIAEMLPANTAALIALIEHTWATEISEAVGRAGGRLLVSQRISPRTVNELSDELEALMTAPAKAR